jgi:SAM-dependent methyltransferase
MSRDSGSAKQGVRDFWNEASCGEDLYLSGRDRQAYDAQAKRRYELEPYIVPFAGFEGTAGRKVLEIGVGLGADHQRFAEAGADLHGLDLTERAIVHTRNRLDAMCLHSVLQVGDAEHLQFADASFDMVYSWGVLHHSPDTPRAIGEVWRVLRDGGVAKIMIYHKWSMIGIMLWLRYGLLAGRPFIGFRHLYDRYLESPGTKAYTRAEARELFRAFASVDIATVLTHGDLLESEAGQRHRGSLLSIARAIWPRWLIRRLFPGAGLFMLITARK